MSQSAHEALRNLIDMGGIIGEQAQVIATEGLDAALAEAHAWARATFPHETTESVVKHLRKEVVELANAPGDPGEIADCLILVARLADRHGIDLAAAVHAKLAILRTREWGEPDADGVVEHVRR